MMLVNILPRLLQSRSKAAREGLILAYRGAARVMAGRPAADVSVFLEQHERSVQVLREFERQLAERQEDVLRLERENENLEGQVEQLTIALMDANSKKTDSELRLRQFQQVRR